MIASIEWDWSEFNSPPPYMTDLTARKGYCGGGFLLKYADKFAAPTAGAAYPMTARLADGRTVKFERNPFVPLHLDIQQAMMRAGMSPSLQPVDRPTWQSQIDEIKRGMKPIREFKVSGVPIKIDKNGMIRDAGGKFVGRWSIANVRVRKDGSTWIKRPNKAKKMAWFKFQSK